MTLAPLLNASPIIQVHAFAAMAAFALGVVQFAAPKGTLPHRTIGWLWVALMTVIASEGSGRLAKLARRALSADPPVGRRRAFTQRDTSL